MGGYSCSREEHNRQNREAYAAGGAAARDRVRRSVQVNRRKDFLRYLLTGARGRAKARGLEFSIQRSDLTLPERCPVFGVVLALPLYGDGSRKPRPNAPSLDRIDSSKGYVPGNVRVISHRANVLKSNGTLAEFELVVRDARILAGLEHTDE